MILTFEKGYFYLSTGFGKQIRQLPDWEQVDANTYRTRYLKAAAVFRSSSDERARKVFDRAFCKHYEIPDLPPLSFLDPLQIEGVRWVLSRSRSYLAHAPGAGKTYEAITAGILAEGEGQVVFIIPPGLTLNWQKEIWAVTEHFGIFPTIGVVPKSDKQDTMAWGADFIICPISMIAKPWVNDRLRKMKIKLLAVDEASGLKEPTTERGAAFYGGVNKGIRYHGIYQHARHVVFLDGSPMPNRPMELWAPTFALHPEAIDCMEQRDFGFRYCGAKMNARGAWEFNHSSNEAELSAKLQKDFMHVVREDQLGHAERRRSILFMDQDVRSPDHKTWERKHLSSFSFDDLDENANQGDLARFRQELGVRKIPWIAAYIKERLKNKNEKILLFAWHREVCLGLAEALAVYTPGVIIGGVTNAYKDDVLETFRSGKIKLIIANIAKMGRGENVQEADRIIFGEYSWTDELNKQCEKRASRRGRDKDAFVRCEYIVCPGSMDEPVLNANFTKEKRVRKIIG